MKRQDLEVEIVERAPDARTSRNKVKRWGAFLLGTALIVPVSLLGPTGAIAQLANCGTTGPAAAPAPVVNSTPAFGDATDLLDVIFQVPTGTATSTATTINITDLLDLFQEAPVVVDASGSVSGDGDTEGGKCPVDIDQETGDTGDVEVTATSGDTGDAEGGDSIATGTSGNVAVGGNGGGGGANGGSGDYAGAIIGNNNDGGGGPGGPGGAATCSAPAGEDGSSCFSGSVTVSSAEGGEARSGDSGEVTVKGTSSGDTGSNDVESNEAP